MTGFVYKWTNNVNGRWYIGSHKGTTDDGYRHSSKILALAENKYGLENFTREILFEGEYDTGEVKDHERELLVEHNAANDPLSYNQTNMAGLNCFSPEVREKMAQAQLGSKDSKETRKKKSEALSAFYAENGRSEEHRKNMSKANKGKKFPGRSNAGTWKKGQKPWNAGKTGLYKMSEETKAKMRAAQQARREREKQSS